MALDHRVLKVMWNGKLILQHIIIGDMGLFTPAIPIEGGALQIDLSPEIKEKVCTDATSAEDLACPEKS